MDEPLKPAMPRFSQWYAAIQKINPEWRYFDEDFLRWAWKECPLFFLGGDELNQAVDMMHRAWKAAIKFMEPSIDGG